MSSKVIIAKGDFIKLQIEKGAFTPKSTVGMRVGGPSDTSLSRLTVIVVNLPPNDGLVLQPSTVQAVSQDGSRIPTFGVIKAIGLSVMIFSCFARKAGGWSALPGNPVTPVSGYQGPDSKFGGNATAQFAFAFPAEAFEKIISLEVEAGL